MYIATFDANDLSTSTGSGTATAPAVWMANNATTQAGPASATRSTRWPGRTPWAWRTAAPREAPSHNPACDRPPRPVDRGCTTAGVFPNRDALRRSSSARDLNRPTSSIVRLRVGPAQGAPGTEDHGQRDGKSGQGHQVLERTVDGRREQGERQEDVSQAHGQRCRPPLSGPEPETWKLAGEEQVQDPESEERDVPQSRQTAGCVPIAADSRRATPAPPWGRRTTTTRGSGRSRLRGRGSIRRTVVQTIRPHGSTASGSILLQPLRLISVCRKDEGEKRVPSLHS